ncbi:hypothetical protein WDH52_22090 [Streptomyces sp. TRM70308]|uniref:hypothetical protein n=1 Tax=Streptomyces sp. TRM70308 TaxID=3131932 RepID=UPI003D0879A0
MLHGRPRRTRHEDIDEWLNELERSGSRAVAQRALSSAARQDDEREPASDRLCDAVVSDLLPDREHTEDDAVLLVLHTPRTIPGPPERPVGTLVSNWSSGG